MKAIKMGILHIGLLMFWFTSELSFAQIMHEDVMEMAAKYYELENVKMSENGRWLTVRKIYDSNRDTVLIFDAHHSGKPLGFRTKINEIHFLNNEHLLLKGTTETELLNLKNNKSIYFKGVDQLKVLNNGRFLLQYSKEENSKLEFYNEKGNLLNSIEKIITFYVTEKGSIYAIKENRGDESEIVLFSEKEAKGIYKTLRKIRYLKAVPDGNAMMIYEQNPENALSEIIYLDLMNKTSFPLKDVLPLNIKTGIIEAVNESLCFLKLRIDEEKPDNSFVDIWYGNDNQLEEKIYPPEKELYFLWNPKKKIIREVGNKELTKNIYIENERYFLSFDPFHFRDYRFYYSLAPLDIYLYDNLNDSYSYLDKVSSHSITSGNGEFLLSFDKKNWTLYTLSSKSKIIIPQKNLKTPYFSSNEKYIYFESDNGLWKFDIEKNKLLSIGEFKDYKTTIINGTTKNLSNGQLTANTVDIDDPLIVQLFNQVNRTSSYVLIGKKGSKTIVPFTSKSIQHLNYNKDYRYFSYLEENYNLPPRLVLKEAEKKETLLYQSNPNDEKIKSLIQEIHTYTNSIGDSLKGVLYYPINYDSSKRYPMVVHIYQIQSHRTHYYPMLYYNTPNYTDGFNLRLLLEEGYFVYFPDIVYGKDGTGLSALDCVNQAIDALNGIGSINFDKIGLTGHSHGGYQTNFIATHSDRFATYISGAGNSDIIRSYFSFNYNFLVPFYFQYENGQYEMNKSFNEDMQLYFNNNPIHYVDQVNSPMLLWTGMKDENIYWDQTMEFYIGLKRNDKKVVALFYPDEEHSLSPGKPSQDLTLRILQWFNYFLKDEKNIDWIEKEMKKDAE